MDEFEQRKKAVLAPIYFEAGAGLMDCQSFEYAAAYFLYLLSRLGAVGLSPERCTAILDDEEKKTAGQLIQLLRQHVRVDDDLEDALAAALSARNRLVHRYLTENVERFGDVSQNEAIVKEIRNLRSEVRAGNEQLHPFIKQLTHMLDGVDVDEVMNEAKRQFLKSATAH